MCAICRTKKPKKKLFRFVIKNKETIFDKKKSELGRGFYICSKECWDSAVKKKKKIKISSRENRLVSLPEKKFEEVVG